MFKKAFSFNGRIRRLEYGLSLLIMYAFLILSAFLFAPDVFTNPENSEAEPSLIFSLSVIPAMYFWIAQIAKRCHDRGNSGWWMFIPFYSFLLFFLESEIGENRFGPNPKGEGNYDNIDEIGNYLETE